MIHFRVRDYVSVILYRLFAPLFGGFGRRVRIVWPLRLVGSRHIFLGDDVTLHYGAYLAVLPGREPRLQLGSGSMIGNHAHIIVTRSIEIGRQVLIADRAYIADNRHGYEDISRAIIEQPIIQLADVRIGDGTWIGENVCIMGCSIGRHCVVGANSVVTRDVPDYCVAAGAPAIIVKRYCEQSGQWLRTDRDGNFIGDDAE